MPKKFYEINPWANARKNDVTAINFILPLNSKFKCKFKFTEYLRGTKYLFVIY